ncbi:DNA cytosine methyltransferase [Primorskyibacter aestuariivivens]|uniref:DNA cytosine methyltransferase n=1 Tax=Primorskyibacter aestuariivivens TaxID=1888912 RepID=UPI002301C7FF|nr:DNA cytosine methyltransferase [Primorskyibacter aestuariivivens]MDA7430187.1 DNA cytosine methyltransferase [Primorskyibacter aestuariivivens]
MNQHIPQQLDFLSAARTQGTRKRAISFFSGAGGLDLGIQLASNGKIEFTSWTEIDAVFRDTIQENTNCDPKRIWSDINEVNPYALLEQAECAPGETFAVVGGPPCQAFSTAGLRRSVHDERGQVVQSYLNAIKIIKPRFFVFENVRGLLSVALKHRNYAERIEAERKGEDKNTLSEEERLGSVFNLVVLPAFKRLGYEIVYGLVNAADYGTAQIRHRLVIFGSRDNEFGSGKYRKTTGQVMPLSELMPPTHNELAPYSPIKRWRTLRDAIGHLADTVPNNEETFGYSDARTAIWKRIPPGNYWTYIRDNPDLFPEGLETLLGGAFKSGGGKVGYWRRLSWDRPAPTLPTQPQHLSTGLCHPAQERPLSVTEYSALQDFPANYRFSGNKAKKYEQIGNAVPVRLGEAIGRSLLAISQRTDCAK